MSTPQKNLPRSALACDTPGHCFFTRRRLLSGAAGAAGGLLFAGSSHGELPAPRAKVGIIDVHHHISPPALIRSAPHIEPPTRDWTPARSIEGMDRAGVSTSIVSTTSATSWITDGDVLRSLAREYNIYAAKLAADYPGRFGVFATLPLPDINASLREIAFAFDTIKADGIGVLTSYGSTYLGNSVLDPVMEELNRRKAIVYVHPSAPICCRNLLPDVNYSVIEFSTDMTRAITNLIFTGTTTKFPHIRFIFAHAGGTMPFIYQRLTKFPEQDQAMNLGYNIAAKVPGGVIKELQSFYYDTAQAAHPMAMMPLAKLVSTSQILFGSDFPYVAPTVNINGLAECGFKEAEIDAIYRGNATRLMPRFSAKA